MHIAYSYNPCVEKLIDFSVVGSWSNNDCILIEIYTQHCHPFKLTFFSIRTNKKSLIYLLLNNNRKKKKNVFTDECMIDSFILCRDEKKNHIFIRVHIYKPSQLDCTLNEMIRNYSEIIFIWNENVWKREREKKNKLFSVKLREVDFMTLRLWVIGKVFQR